VVHLKLRRLRFIMGILWKGTALAVPPNLLTLVIPNRFSGEESAVALTTDFSLRLMRQSPQFKLR
jgi:hypothetical protein